MYLFMKCAWFARSQCLMKSRNEATDCQLIDFIDNALKFIRMFSLAQCFQSLLSISHSSLLLDSFFGWNKKCHVFLGFVMHSRHVDERISTPEIGRTRISKIQATFLWLNQVKCFQFRLFRSVGSLYRKWITSAFSHEHSSAKCECNKANSIYVYPIKRIGGILISIHRKNQLTISQCQWRSDDSVLLTLACSRTRL